VNSAGIWPWFVGGEGIEATDVTGQSGGGWPPAGRVDKGSSGEEEDTERPSDGDRVARNLSLDGPFRFLEKIKKEKLTSGTSGRTPSRARGSARGTRARTAAAPPPRRRLPPPPSPPAQPNHGDAKNASFLLLADMILCCLREHSRRRSRGRS
jgi:hypothetical protein